MLEVAEFTLFTSLGLYACAQESYQLHVYRIAGYFRGGKFSRMHDAESFRGENFRGWLTRS